MLDCGDLLVYKVPVYLCPEGICTHGKYVHNEMEVLDTRNIRSM
jgi:hypothetical protein